MANSRKRRRKASSRLTDILSAAALIVIAVLLLVFVLSYIKNNSFSDLLPFGSEIKETRSSLELLQESTGADAAEADTDEGSNEGFVFDGKSLVYVLNDDEAEGYDEDNVLEAGDMKLLRSSWLEQDEELYYFGDDGYAVDEYAEGAFDYTFDDSYRLTEISFNSRYSDPDESEDYPGVCTTKALWAFVSDDKNSAGLYTVKYKKTTESFSHKLGDDSAAQLTTKYAMSIADGYIYYIAFVEDADSILLKNIANKLFRMKPGAAYREIAAEDVQGYKIIEDNDGSAHVYYYDGRRLRLAEDFEKDETLKSFPDDGDYSVDISSGKAVLMLDGIYPVTMESQAFKAGNFTYAVDANGEITSVAAKSTVVYGGYTYTVENGESFGTQKARIVRQGTDSKEVISAEFDGTVANLHFDFDSSRIIAEYKSSSGKAGLISASLDGDVDLIIDPDSELGTCSLYAIENGYAIVKTDDSSEPFRKLRLSSAYPLAAGVDPASIQETESEASSEQHINETASDKTVSETAAAHTDELTANAPVASNESGSASGSNGTNIINNHATEKIGPGN